MAKEDLGTATTKVKAVVTALNTKPINLGLLFTNLVDGTNKIVDYLKWVNGKMTLEAIDLGLPSGLKWANMNVGASAPEDYGEYFAWGDIVGNKGGTYNSSTQEYNGNSSVLPLERDAARQNMGGSWRMPTKAECDELKANTTTTWTTLNGVNGMLFASKINGATLFFPASGYHDTYSMTMVGDTGICWSSSLNTKTTYYAYYLTFSPYGVGVTDYYRERGHTVRGVC